MRCAWFNSLAVGDGYRLLAIPLTICVTNLPYQLPHVMSVRRHELREAIHVEMMNRWRCGDLKHQISRQAAKSDLSYCLRNEASAGSGSDDLQVSDGRGWPLQSHN